MARVRRVDVGVTKAVARLGLESTTHNPWRPGKSSDKGSWKL